MKNTDNDVLDFDHVALADGDGREFTDVNMSLAWGDVAVVKFGHETTMERFFDLAQGLVDPSEGRVEFLGRDWRNLTSDGQISMRGRMGRVFRGHGWISNLSFYDNITLGQRHHTTRSEGDIREEVGRLGEFFGLKSMPEAHPDTLGVDVLRRGEWIRAFLGRPDLVLLERPERGVRHGEVKMLVDAVKDAADNGAAVVWAVADEHSTGAGLFIGARHYIFENGTIRPEVEEGNAKTV